LKFDFATLRRSVFVLFCFLTAAILWLTLEPTPGGGRAHELPRALADRLNQHDSFSNSLAFFVFSAVAFWLGHYPKRLAEANARSIIRTQRLRFLLLLGFVESLEFLQIWIPGRVSDLGDVLFGWMGVALAGVCYLVFARFQKR
jgi:hypothetical protein